MSADPYSQRVRELFATTPHAGVIDGGVSVLIEDQGLRLELSAKLVGDRVEELGFRAWGCPHLIAAAAAFCTGYKGQQLTHLEQFSAAGLMQTLAVPVEKTGRILVLEDAVRSLGAAARKQSELHP
jgi:NifU-like protein involved in Fe-S cluster formation